MTCVLRVMGELEEKEVPNVLSSLSVGSTGLCWERSWNRHCHGTRKGLNPRQGAGVQPSPMLDSTCDLEQSLLPSWSLSIAPAGWGLGISVLSEGCNVTFHGSHISDPWNSEKSLL